MKLSSPTVPRTVHQRTRTILLRFSWRCQRCLATSVVEMPPTETCLDLDRRIRQQHRNISSRCNGIRIENIAQLETLFIETEDH